MDNKVLIISGTPIISGAEIVLGDYLKEHDKINQFIILSSDLPDVKAFYQGFKVEKHYYSKYLVPVGAVNRRFFGLVKKVLYLLLSFFVFRKVLKNKAVKTVLGNNTGDVVYSIWSHLYGKKHINYIHDMVAPRSLIAKSTVFFDRFVSRYIAVSFAVKKALIEIGIDESKIEVIYNGLEPKESFVKKEITYEINFGFVGNISNLKNPIDFVSFINAANKSLSISVRAKMVFGNILDQTLFDQVKQLIKENNLDVELVGALNRKDMDKFYQGIHFLVVTSKKDSLPTVIMEAFNEGVPVIGHAIDGIPEMIEHGINGFLYSNINEFEDLLKSIDQCNYSTMQYSTREKLLGSFTEEKKSIKLDEVVFL